MRSITQENENIFLLAWFAFAIVIIFASLFRNRHPQKSIKIPRSATGVRRSISPQIKPTSHPQKKTHHKIPVIQHSPLALPLFPEKKTDNTSSECIRKSNKRRDSKTETPAPTEFFSSSILPSEIRFSHQFVYPSPSNPTGTVYPLPGMESANPVARISIAGQFMLIYNTQFGVLAPLCELSENDLAVHKNCLETQKVVFDRNLRFFKTRPVKTCGDQRVYATQIIKKEGLTLHVFDKIEQHAHIRK